MSKHSEGEWEAIEGCMVRIPYGTLALDCTDTGVDYETVKANAKLIAAAPDLLKALTDTPRLAYFMNSWICEFKDNETVCTAIRDMGEWDALCGFQDMLKEHADKARTAIKKATG